MTKPVRNKCDCCHGESTVIVGDNIELRCGVCHGTGESVAPEVGKERPEMTLEACRALADEPDECEDYCVPCNQLGELREALRWLLALFDLYLKDTTDGMECPDGCDSYAHEDDCPVAYPVEAWRLLRAEVEQLRAELADCKDMREDDRQ